MEYIVDGRCYGCPKKCGALRDKQKGLCGASDKVFAAKACVHNFEEPLISGTKGSGTVFFSHCNLACVFCQNHQISAQGYGIEISIQRLADIFCWLEQQGVHNINLVSPTQYSYQIMRALDIFRPKIPIVYNTNGYERVEVLHMLRDYVDVYLTDIKYFDSNLAQKYSGVGDYFDYAYEAAKAMSAQKPEIISNGLLKQGVVIRHLVLPSHYKDSLVILQKIKEALPNALVSIMAQYYPAHRANDYAQINRRLTSFEYNKVVELAQRLELRGFVQSLDSAQSHYTPIFDGQGII